MTTFAVVGDVLVAALVVGVLSRLFARRLDAPWTLWAVPAVLVLLPGLAIVRAMLAPSAVLQISLLADALLTAFAIGVGVASGDILVSTYLQIREVIVDPVVGAVAGVLVTRSADAGSPRAPVDDGPDVPAPPR